MKRYRPLSSVVAVCAPWGPVRVAVAPGSTAPCSSVTVPSTMLTEVWAAAAVERTTAASSSALRRLKNFVMVISLLRRRGDAIVLHRIERVADAEHHHREGDGASLGLEERGRVLAGRALFGASCRGSERRARGRAGGAILQR